MEAYLIVQCITTGEIIKYINILPGNKEIVSQLTESQELKKIPEEPQWARLKTNIRR